MESARFKSYITDKFVKLTDEKCPEKFTKKGIFSWPKVKKNAVPDCNHTQRDRLFYLVPIKSFGFCWLPSANDFFT